MDKNEKQMGGALLDATQKSEKPETMEDAPLEQTGVNPNADPTLEQTGVNPNEDAPLEQTGVNPNADPTLEQTGVNPNEDAPLEQTGVNPNADPTLEPTGVNPNEEFHPDLSDETIVHENPLHAPTPAPPPLGVMYPGSVPQVERKMYADILSFGLAKPSREELMKKAATWGRQPVTTDDFDENHIALIVPGYASHYKVRIPVSGFFEVK